MNRFEIAVYTAFSYLPLALIIAISLLIIGIIQRKRGNSKKFFILSGIFFGIFLIWFIVLFFVGLFGFGSGRAN